MHRRRYKLKSTSYRQNDLSVKTKKLVQTQGKVTGKTDDTNVARCQKKNQHPQNTLRNEKD